ncbi:hypothetical protein V6N13_088421 [Hibiscus sabdariffa]
MRHIRLLAEGGDDRNLSACWKLPCLAWDSIPTMDVNPCMEHRKARTFLNSKTTQQDENHVVRDNLVKSSNGGEQVKQHQATFIRKGESSNPLNYVKRRITGHVEEEDLMKLRRCLVGEMASVSSVKSINERIVGSFEFLGENATKTLDCEKSTVLVVTNHACKTDEVVEVEVGDLIFDVRVAEIGFSNEPNIISKKGAKDRNKEGSELKVGESSSESTSDKPIFQAPEDSVQMKDTVDEVALMATCFRKEIYDENSNGKRVGSINLDENELVGGAFEETNNSRSNIGEKDIVITQKVVSALLDNGLDEVDRQIVTADKTGPKWADVVGCLGGAGQATGLQPVSDLVSSRAMKDIRSMGLTEVMVFNSNVE